MRVVHESRDGQKGRAVRVVRASADELVEDANWAFAGDVGMWEMRRDGMPRPL